MKLWSPERVGSGESRDAITENVETSANDMRMQVGELNQIKDDVETVRNTLASLEFKGTSEGGDEVRDAMTSAEDITVDIFDQEDRQLDDTQAENESYEEELEGRSDADQSDVTAVEEAATRIETRDTTGELERARDAALRDIDFLLEQIERAASARSETETLQQEFRNHVFAGGAS